MRPTPTHSVLLFLILPTFTRCLTAPPPYETTYILPSDAVSLLSFKSKADSDNKLLYTLTERFDYCQWQGVKCLQGRVVRFLVQGFGLRGTFPPDTLSRLDQLRVLSFSNNSLSGPVPDLSTLLNLESLSLDHNSFSGTFPPSVLSLHRLTVLDLSYNNLSGPVPVQLSSLNRLYLLRLQWNRFNGTVPALNQRFLICFNVSGNNLTGQIPVTPTLSRFGATSFSLNPDLCGEIINKVCKSHSPFFASSSSGNATSPTEPLGQSAKAKGGGTVIVSSPPSMPPKHKRIGIIIESIIGVSFLILALVLTFFTLVKKQRKQNTESPEKQLAAVSSADRRAVSRSIPMEAPGGVMHAKTTETAAKEVQAKRAEKSGKLVFCGGGNVGEAPWPYTLDQLMRASAELLGRGTIGTTYKAVLDNQLVVTVKRLDANKTWITSSDAFERHMDVVGEVRHPNLVPMLAYFQTKGERLVIYEYQPNGSLFSLIHGSRSTRARPLHWTSCLKIAEDVVQGLAYLHQTSKLVHGNLKSSNVLLGADFEACITDYCLAILADTSSEEPDSAAYKAPETRNFNRQATVKSDVYAFGVLLLELLTGKHPSQHPYLAPADMFDWVRVVREDGGGNENQLGMLTELASVCSLTSPEQRPAIWQVLKMVQEIKESAMVEENSPAGYL